MSQALTPKQGSVSPESLEDIRDLENRFALAVRQRDLLEEYIRKRLKPEHHYYTVSGGQKPGLTKEGAELICLAHGYKPLYFREAGPDQPPADDSPYQITVRCRLMCGENFNGEGYGSASSHITKKGGERIPRQGDIGLRHNATLKMAQKSSYIAATLNATAASEFFTQDMEEEGAVASKAEPSSGAASTDPLKVCFEHHDQWFKGGKMTDFGHKYEDTWCWRKSMLAKQYNLLASQFTPVASLRESMGERWATLDDAGKGEALLTLMKNIAAKGQGDEPSVRAQDMPEEKPEPTEAKGMA